MGGCDVFISCPVDTCVLSVVFGPRVFGHVQYLRFRKKLIAVGEYTIFAPTDLAFGRFSTLNKITRETPNYRMIYYEVLKYHIVPGARYSYQLQDQQKLYTLHGAPITVTLPGQGVSIDGVANVVEANIPASNGVIHAIDHVLYPADLLQALINTTTPSPSG